MRSCVLLIALTVTSLSPPAQAAPPARSTPSQRDRPAPLKNAKAIDKQLASTDPAQWRSAWQLMRQVGRSAAPFAARVEASLRDGLPPELAKEAMTALASIQLESSSQPVSLYLYHRDPTVRRAAAQSLIKTGGAIAAKSLRATLSDADPSVRAVAASGLGALQAHDALPDLILSLDRKVPEAAAAIGQLCTPDQCKQFAAKLGSVALDVMMLGFDQILFRPEAEIPEPLKIELVENIRDVGTQDANRFLRDVLGRWPATSSKRIKKSLELAISATDASVGTKDPQP